MNPLLFPVTFATLTFFIWYPSVGQTAKGRAMDSGFFVRDSSSSMAVLGGCLLGTPLQCIVLLVVASVVWLLVTP